MHQVRDRRRLIPMAQGIFQRLFDRAHFDAGGQQFGNIQNAIGARRLGSVTVKFLVILPKFKAAVWFEDALESSQ